MMCVVCCVQAPVILRLVYHDAGTYDVSAGDGGLNGSVRFELERQENFGLKRGWNLIDEVCLGPLTQPSAHPKP
jgi:catalase (peroxidase I)